jgi:type I restriction enzyme S subunit
MKTTPPTGYKQTEIGLLPNEWEVVELGEVCQIFGRIGFRGYTKKDIVKPNEGAISISPSNIKNHRIDFRNSTYISWFKYEESPEIKIFNGDIILVKTGSTFGKTAFVRGLNVKATLNPQVVVLKKITVENAFLALIMSNEVIQNQIKSTIVGGAIPTLSQKQVEKFKIPLPPLPEQKAIAAVLSDTDALIEALNAKISKKKRIKQAAMRQLLTPKEGWETKTLREVCIEGGLIRGPFGGALKKDFFKKTGHKVYEQKNAIYKRIDIGDYFIDDVKFAELKRFEVGVGDFIISCSGTIGKIYRIPKNSPRGVINQALLKITIDESIIDPMFFYFNFVWEDFQNKIIEGTQGGAMKNLIGMSEFKQTIMYLPTLEEQTRIATILSDMDAEIELLETKRNKYQTIKQGLMQDLLTGKRRLISEPTQI